MNGPIDDEYLQKAREFRDALLQSSVSDVLLHGDLYHDNILRNGNDWLVIDPKGGIGKPAYDASAFIRNPIPALLNRTDAAIIASQLLQSALENLPKGFLHGVMCRPYWHGYGRWKMGAIHKNF